MQRRTRNVRCKCISIKTRKQHDASCICTYSTLCAAQCIKYQVPQNSSSRLLRPSPLPHPFFPSSYPSPTPPQLPHALTKYLASTFVSATGSKLQICLHALHLPSPHHVLPVTPPACAFCTLLLPTVPPPPSSSTTILPKSKHGRQNIEDTAVCEVPPHALVYVAAYINKVVRDEGCKVGKVSVPDAWPVCANARACVRGCTRLARSLP